MKRRQTKLQNQLLMSVMGADKKSIAKAIT
jgi:hypothetical protein